MELKPFTNITIYRKEGMNMPKVALFVTCLSDTLFPSVGQATVELLEHLGCDVSFPFEQTCCGQPAYNSGYHEETKKVAKHMIETFEKADADYIVGPSGSCVMMMRDYPHLFKDDPAWKARAEAHAAKTFELTQFIVDVLEVKDVGAKFPAKATYHASCHMTRLLGIEAAPGQLLKHVDGLTMLPLDGVHNCCGFGGDVLGQDAGRIGSDGRRESGVDLKLRSGHLDRCGRLMSNEYRRTPT